MIITRFAPSPTGRLHLGHAFSAVVAERTARASGGEMRLRIDDLDPGRSREEFIDAIFEDLDWLGVRWEGEVLRESRRQSRYSEALEQLKSAGLAYACFCTRADIAESQTAPHGDAGAHYPGTCRGLPDDPERRAAVPHCWRLDSAKALERAGLPQWIEADGTRFTASAGDIDDAVLARKDAPSSYHLACVLDDFDSGVTMVVRGEDLRPSTPVQRLLQSVLGLAEPTYLHHPLVTHDDGRRLAKRDEAPTLAAMRNRGIDGRALADNLAAGLMPSGFRLRQD